MARLWIITYDIADPRRLRQVADCLAPHGERVQWSAFEIWLDRHRAATLKAELQTLIDPEADSIRLYPLCGRCINRVRWQGEGSTPGDHTYWIV